MENIKFDLNNLDMSIPESALHRKVCVFGQGFVGLPLTLSFALRGCDAIGVDVNEELVNEINNGITHHTEKFHDITIQEILNMQLNEKRYCATTDAAAAVRECNNIVVTVGIPVKENGHVMDYLEEACTIIGRNLKKEDLVVIRSTVVPGTTEEFVLPILEKESGMKAGVDFYLAYASERIAEGKAFDEFANMPTLVGAVNKASLYRAIDLLAVVCKAEIVPASSIKAVETSKVFENVQRDVNIAMAQEFARFTEGLGIDIFEVVKLANTHKRVNLLTPGPGVGGYCIPNAYHYVAPKANELGITMDILKLSREKNSKLPEFIVEKTVELLKEAGKDIKNSKIAVLGIAMKDFSNDDRISPPIDIIRLLLNSGAEVRAFDPIVPTKYDFKVDTEKDALKEVDAVLILAKQNEIDFSVDTITEYTSKDVILIDTKNVISYKSVLGKALKLWKI